jgi:hypothetical protein
MRADEGLVGSGEIEIRLINNPMLKNVSKNSWIYHLLGI